jgi:small subunit ribosomal protein S20
VRTRPSGRNQVEENVANSSSARKRIRSALRKHEQNRGVRSAVRTAVVKARRAVTEVDEGSAELVRLASSALDKAAEHGVLHARNVSRRKSRLMKLAAKVGTEAVTTPAPKRRATTAKGAKAKAPASKRAASGTKAKPQTKTERTAARTRKTTAGAGTTDRS